MPFCNNTHPYLPPDTVFEQESHQDVIPDGYRKMYFIDTKVTQLTHKCLIVPVHGNICYDKSMSSFSYTPVPGSALVYVRTAECVLEPNGPVQWLPIIEHLKRYQRIDITSTVVRRRKYNYDTPITWTAGDTDVTGWPLWEAAKLGVPKASFTYQTMQVNGVPHKFLKGVTFDHLKELYPLYGTATTFYLPEFSRYACHDEEVCGTTVIAFDAGAMNIIVDGVDRTVTVDTTLSAAAVHGGEAQMLLPIDRLLPPHISREKYANLTFRILGIPPGTAFKNWSTTPHTYMCAIGGVEREVADTESLNSMGLADYDWKYGDPDLQLWNIGAPKHIDTVRRTKEVTVVNIITGFTFNVFVSTVTTAYTLTKEHHVVTNADGTVQLRYGDTIVVPDDGVVYILSDLYTHMSVWLRGSYLNTFLVSFCDTVLFRAPPDRLEKLREVTGAQNIKNDEAPIFTSPRTTGLDRVIFNAEFETTEYTEPYMISLSGGVLVEVLPKYDVLEVVNGYRGGHLKYASTKPFLEKCGVKSNTILHNVALKHHHHLGRRVNAMLGAYNKLDWSNLAPSLAHGRTTDAVNLAACTFIVQSRLSRSHTCTYEPTKNVVYVDGVKVLIHSTDINDVVAAFCVSTAVLMFAIVGTDVHLLSYVDGHVDVSMIGVCTWQVVSVGLECIVESVTNPEPYTTMTNKDLFRGTQWADVDVYGYITSHVFLMGGAGEYVCKLVECKPYEAAAYASENLRPLLPKILYTDSAGAGVIIMQNLVTDGYVTLSHLMKEQQMPQENPTDTVRWYEGCREALLCELDPYVRAVLDKLHETHVCHDFRPPNIMVRHNDRTGTWDVRLIDMERVYPKEKKHLRTGHMNKKLRWPFDPLGNPAVSPHIDNAMWEAITSLKNLG